MKRLKIYLPLLFSLIALLSCESMEKVVEVELPVYENQLVVECYLEPGKPYRLMLTESVSYFNGPDTPLVENALVIISHNGVDDTLPNVFSLDFQDLKFYNYTSTSIVPADYNSDFSLYIRDNLGREVTATTQILEPVNFDTLEYDLNAENKAAIVARWADLPGPTWYLFSLHENTLDNEGLEMWFTLSNNIGEGEQYTVQTLYYRDLGDSVICSLYHIDEEYYNFIETTGDAESANGNPFAQPTSIISNINGGIGIFTGLSYTRSSIVIK